MSLQCGLMERFAMGPAVFVCLSLCVCICSVVLMHLSAAHTLASVSILHVVWSD